MRRLLLPSLLALALGLGLVSSALAASRVPAGVRRVSVTLTFPPKVAGTHRAVRRTLVRAATVQRVVSALNGLPVAHVRGLCPMFMRLGPVLTVVLRAGPAGPALARAQVQVVLGSHGSSGSSACFPIRFSSSGHSQALTGNGFVRLMGRLIGTAIS